MKVLKNILEWIGYLILVSIIILFVEIEFSESRTHMLVLVFLSIIYLCREAIMYSWFDKITNRYQYEKMKNLGFFWSKEELKSEVMFSKKFTLNSIITAKMIGGLFAAFLFMFEMYSLFSPSKIEYLAFILKSCTIGFLVIKSIHYVFHYKKEELEIKK